MSTTLLFVVCYLLLVACTERLPRDSSKGSRSVGYLIYPVGWALPTTRFCLSSNTVGCVPTPSMCFTESSGGCDQLRWRCAIAQWQAPPDRKQLNFIFSIVRAYFESYIKSEKECYRYSKKENHIIQRRNRVSPIILGNRPKFSEETRFLTLTVRHCPPQGFVL